MNKVVLAGRVVVDPQFSHEIYNNKYYEVFISSKRSSGAEDIVRCIFSENQVLGINKDDLIEVEGRLISRNVDNGQQISKDVFLRVTSINKYLVDVNVCEIWGNVKVPPSIKETKVGKLLAEFTIWSKREFSERYDQLPCLAWGEMALEAAEFFTGNSIHVIGRVQSRYIRKHNKTVYEVSIPRSGELERWEN